MLGQEPLEVRREVPRAGRQVDHEVVLACEGVEQLGHAGYRTASSFREDERVPRGEQRARDPCHDDRVVDVADDAAHRLRIDGTHATRDGLAAIHCDDHLVPPGPKHHRQLGVDIATTLGGQCVVAFVDGDRHRCTRSR
jgi:hypothetical protein